MWMGQKFRLIVQQSAGCPVRAIKAAAIAGNIRQQPGAGLATFTAAHALVTCPLPHRRQNRKCLQIIQLMTFQ
jgi:hypothetical protein